MYIVSFEVIIHRSSVLQLLLLIFPALMLWTISRNFIAVQAYYILSLVSYFIITHLVILTHSIQIQFQLGIVVELTSSVRPSKGALTSPSGIIFKYLYILKYNPS